MTDGDVVSAAAVVFVGNTQNRSLVMRRAMMTMILSIPTARSTTTKIPLMEIVHYSSTVAVRSQNED